MAKDTKYIWYVHGWDRPSILCKACHEAAAAWPIDPQHEHVTETDADVPCTEVNCIGETSPQKG